MGKLNKPILSQVRRVTASIRREMKRRAAVEMRSTRQRPTALILIDGAIAALHRQSVTLAADLVRDINDQ